MPLLHPRGVYPLGVCTCLCITVSFVCQFIVFWKVWRFWILHSRFFVYSLIFICLLDSVLYFFDVLKVNFVRQFIVFFEVLKVKNLTSSRFFVYCLFIIFLCMFVISTFLRPWRLWLLHRLVSYLLICLFFLFVRLLVNFLFEPLFALPSKGCKSYIVVLLIFCLFVCQSI